MILSINNLSKNFGDKEILKNINFTVDYNEKIALVGANGAGKSTLLKTITNEMSIDSGDIFIGKDCTVGYLSQNFDTTTDYTIYEYVLLAFKNLIEIEERLLEYQNKMNELSGLALEDAINKYTKLNTEFEELDGYSYKSRINGVLRGLGFSSDDFNKRISSLSGGQKTRLSLSKTLLESPSILMLDEPTNHIDVKSIEWLEVYLKNYKGAVIIISHDRYFLDNFVTKVIEIENGTNKIYNGDFTDYLTKKEIDQEIELQHYLKNQKELKRQEKIIQMYLNQSTEKSVKRARSRQKMLDKMNVIPKPIEIDTKMKLRLETEIQSGFDVLDVNGLSMSFKDKTLFDEISFSVKRGEKIALVGDNGVGKTTLFKILLNELNPTSGNFKLGTNVNISYYEQTQEVLDEDLTLFDTLNNINSSITNFEVRNYLARFMFYEDDISKKVSSLSGGEKGRLALAKIMYGKSNFLLLDEPTNHLDIHSKDILENAIKNYDGTVLFISHDRYFINNVCDKVIELKDKKVNVFVGDYDYYISRRITNSTDLDEVTTISSSKLKREEQKELDKINRKKQRQVEKLEKEIEKIEIKLEDLDLQLHDDKNANDVQKLNEIYSEKESLEITLNNLMEEWESIL